MFGASREGARVRLVKIKKRREPIHEDKEDKFECAKKREEERLDALAENVAFDLREYIPYDYFDQVKTALLQKTEVLSKDEIRERYNESIAEIIGIVVPFLGGDKFSSWKAVYETEEVVNYEREAMVQQYPEFEIQDACVRVYGSLLRQRGAGLTKKQLQLRFDQEVDAAIRVFFQRRSDVGNDFENVRHLRQENSEITVLRNATPAERRAMIQQFFDLDGLLALMEQENLFCAR